MPIRIKGKMRPTPRYVGGAILEARRRTLIALLRLAIHRAKRRESDPDRATFDAVAADLAASADELATIATELGDDPSVP